MEAKFTYPKLNNMYQVYNDNRTQARYNQILNETLDMTKDLMTRFPEISMYNVIYDQIVDIKKNVIESGKRLTEDEIYKRYNLGSIAVHNFDTDHDEYGIRLTDVFGGCFDYHEVPPGKETTSHDETPPKPSGGWSVL